MNTTNVAEVVREMCAKVCEKRAERRFEEHGYTEPDTNAGYYVGEWKDLGDSLDEEDADCASAIRALDLSAFTDSATPAKGGGANEYAVSHGNNAVTGPAHASAEREPTAVEQMDIPRMLRGYMGSTVEGGIDDADRE